LVFLLSSLLVPEVVRSQPERPKIGLALAGGGAKGAAHIGVLQVLEELNVPVDYIAGTSIGAIIGGLYASGLSAAELEETLAAVDWDDVLDDRPKRRNLAFRRKEDTARYLVPFEAGIGRGGLKWPAGFLQGQKLYFLLQSLTLPVAHVDSFDDLPIPFRCVATDIQTGEMVVLGEGSLAVALRASMAIPTVFAPVELDGRRLVDGGLVRNLPVDVVREMGADIVIAVDVGAPLKDSETESLLQIFEQTMNMLTRKNVEEQLPLADLLIIPPVGKFGTMRFDQVQEIVDLGVSQALAHGEELRSLAVGPDEFQQLAAARPEPGTPPERIGEILIEGNERVDTRTLFPLLRTQAGGPLDLDLLGEDLLRLYGLADFESVTFSLDPGDQPDLALNLREKSWGPNYLRFNFQFSTDFDGDTNIGFLTNVTSRPINRKGGEWRNDLLIGRNSGLFSELYLPLGFKRRWFVAPRIDIENRRPSFYQDLKEVADLDVSTASASFDLGHQFGKFGEIRVGATRGIAEIDLETGVLPDDPDSLLGQRIDVGGVEVRAIVDRVDKVTFPRHGYATRILGFLSEEALGADLEYDKWGFGGSLFSTFARRHSVFLALEGGWSPGGELPIHEEFTLGGFLSLSGFSTGQLRGQYFGVARVGYYTNFGRLFVGGFAEGGNVWQLSQEASFDDLIYTGTLFIGSETIIGPVYLAYGTAEGGFNSFYLVFGRAF
jgi:NTE family protein